ARLTSIARAEVAGSATLAKAEAAWAGRTLVLCEGEPHPPDWSGEAQDHHASISQVALGAGSTLTMGWGNNVLTVPVEHPHGPLLETPNVRCAVEGIVDAQLLWLELDCMASRSAHLVGWTSHGGRNKIRRGEFGRMSREMS